MALSATRATPSAICSAHGPLLLKKRLQDLLGEELGEAAKGALREMGKEDIKERRFFFILASGNECYLVGKAVDFLEDPRTGGIVIY